MIALYIALGFLFVITAVVTLVCTVRLRFFAAFDDTLIVKMKILFFNFEIIPTEDRVQAFLDKRSEKKKQKLKKIREEERKERAGETFFDSLSNCAGVDGLMDILTEIAQFVGSTVKDLLAKVVIKKFNIDILLRGDDAADTAVKYGKVCGVFYSAVSLILSACKCRNYHLNLTPDFDDSKESEVKCEARFYIRLIHVLAYAVKNYETISRLDV